MKKAEIITEKGTMKLEFFENDAPGTVENFVKLSKEGFYDGLTFHRVINDFMIQGGCPEGTGVGGPGYQFEDEFHSDLKHETPGILSMANAGPKTNGSQFFITHVPTSWLDGKHTVFGSVCSSEDLGIVNKIIQGDLINSISIEGDINELLESQKERVEQWNIVLQR